MNIAICDDDENFCQTLFKMVQVYLQNANLDAQLHIFASVEELCQAIQHKQIALVFLDIELTGMNGVDAGHILRHSQHSDVQIIYVFAKEEYSMQFFQNRPFDFCIYRTDCHNCTGFLPHLAADCPWKVPGKKSLPDMESNKLLSDITLTVWSNS